MRKSICVLIGLFIGMGIILISRSSVKAEDLAYQLERSSLSPEASSKIKSLKYSKDEEFYLKRSRKDTSEDAVPGNHLGGFGVPGDDSSEDTSEDAVPINAMAFSEEGDDSEIGPGEYQIEDPEIREIISDKVSSSNATSNSSIDGSASSQQDQSSQDGAASQQDSGKDQGSEGDSPSGTNPPSEGGKK